MKESIFRLIFAIAVLCAGAIATLRAQQGTLTPAEREQRLQTEKELESAAIIERKVMVRPASVVAQKPFLSVGRK